MSRDPARGLCFGFMAWAMAVGGFEASPRALAGERAERAEVDVAIADEPVACGADQVAGVSPTDDSVYMHDPINSGWAYFGDPADESSWVRLDLRPFGVSGPPDDSLERAVYVVDSGAPACADAGTLVEESIWISVWHVGALLTSAGGPQSTLAAAASLAIAPAPGGGAAAASAAPTSTPPGPTVEPPIPAGTLGPSPTVSSITPTPPLPTPTATLGPPPTVSSITITPTPPPPTPTATFGPSPTPTTVPPPPTAGRRL